MHAIALSALALFALQSGADDDELPPQLPGESAIVLACPEPFSADDARAVLLPAAAKRQAVQIAYETPDLEEAARAITLELEAKQLDVELLPPGAPLEKGPGMRLSRDPLVGLVVELRSANGGDLGRRVVGPCGPQGVLGGLRGSVLGENVVGSGGFGVLGKSGDGSDDDEAVERYLDEMLWLDETRVAGPEGSVHRDYAFFQGRDKRAISLEELLEIAGEDELLERHRSGMTARALTSWTVLGASGVLGLASAAVLGAGLFSHSLGPALGRTPAEVQGLTLWPGLGLMLASVTVLGVGLLVPPTLWPPAEEVPEHELRRSVREHNERLRESLGIETRRDDIPTGVPE